MAAVESVTLEILAEMGAAAFAGALRIYIQPRWKAQENPEPRPGCTRSPRWLPELKLQQRYEEKISSFNPQK